jgi:hypothetical protein
MWYFWKSGYGVSFQFWFPASTILYHLGLGCLSSDALSYFGIWVESETITTFPRFSATLGIIPLLPAIDHWFSVVNSLLHLTTGPFQRTLVWFPELPLWNYMNWNYTQLQSEVLLACVVCCNWGVASLTLPKCWSVEDALRLVFNNVRIPSVVTWNMPTLSTWAEGTGTVSTLSTAQKCGIKFYYRSVGWMHVLA